MIDFNSLAGKWQQRWNDKKVFKSKDKSRKPKFYNLEMFPYPSAYGLHMGHVRNYSIGDTIARFKRMQGFNVLYPMGMDAFGLPAENAAIKEGTHPKEYTNKSISSLLSSLKRLGLSYDWNRFIATCYPEYYRWNQWLFLKFFEKGLAYKKKAPINWCPSCNTVLANEQVVEGKCWRCDSNVEIRDLEQWFLKITAYADELLKDIDGLNWPDRIKAMQRNWIGRSEGTIIIFDVKGLNKSFEVFTTRVDTLYSAAFIVMAPEHLLVHDLVHGTQFEQSAKDFISRVVIDERFSRAAEDKEKEGFFTGRYVVNPLTGKELPIYLANFVLLDYGTGIVFGDAHDQRDFDFARKYNIPLKFTVSKDGSFVDVNKVDKAFTEEGILFDSEEFSGLPSAVARHQITEKLEKLGKGRKEVNYKLRDWLISRQRYWGTPIPIIYCPNCGVVSETKLPVLLPEDVQFTGKGNPLASSQSFVNVKCPKCKSSAKRETDTMDTFVDSSWYFLRFCSPKLNKGPFDQSKVKYWMPVDQYIGGAEHAVMHLLYARFFTKVLRDIGLLDFSEPFAALFNQGIVHKDGVRMSKSKGNIVSQEEVEQKFGIDTARLFLLFVAGPGKDIEWSDEGVQGCHRFLQRLEVIFSKPVGKKDKVIESRVHGLIKRVTGFLNDFELHKCVIALMEFADVLDRQESVSKTVLENYVLLLAPFVPHVAEELWERLGKNKFVCVQKWPKFKENKINPKFDYADVFVEKTKQDLVDVLKLANIPSPQKATLFVADSYKFEIFKALQSALSKSRNQSEIMSVLMNSDLRKHGEFIAKLVPRVLKDPAIIPELFLSQKEELDFLKKSLNHLQKALGCPIELVREKDSVEVKAKQALPGKPAIVVK